MEQRKFGKTDMHVSVLGFGGTEIGMNNKTHSGEDTSKLLNNGLDLGLNVIDTASDNSQIEATIGESLSHRRRHFYLFGKYGEGRAVDLPYPDWDPRNIRMGVERSLRRLRTAYLDLAILDNCTREVLAQGELIEAMKRLKEEGLTRYIGYSGDSTDALYAIETGEFDALETSINLADQEAVSLTLAPAEERGMGIIVKRPVANLVWTRSSEATRAPETYERRLEQLAYPFLDDPPQRLTEIALRFSLSLPQIDTALLRIGSTQQLLDHVGYAARGPLDDELMGLIRRRWREIAEPAWGGLS
ncbi:aldo/keto reductase [Paenibacillus sp. IB182496]|uniref:Aldo/keto reductase n=1 Tax=Paenibacillus sabuli TaxID=2772509 RepID=A0A927BT76_9BACL|nr:aldo/keto reductase [Paenibacillus sabuli]MBD2844988.1 aldo/keto reductase [Paenibacillus sabuli]